MRARAVRDENNQVALLHTKAFRIPFIGERIRCGDYIFCLPLYRRWRLKRNDQEVKIGMKIYRYTADYNYYVY